MHASSYEQMTDPVQRHLDPKQPLSVVNIGSYGVNGSCRVLCTAPGWSYIGIELSAGPGVDFMLDKRHYRQDCWRFYPGLRRKIAQAFIKRTLSLHADAPR